MKLDCGYWVFSDGLCEHGKCINQHVDSSTMVHLVDVRNAKEGISLATRFIGSILIPDHGC